MNPESEATVPTIAKTGGSNGGGKKRKVNKSLKAWVSFVKRVQKEEKLDYKSAIKRAKVRKDKGEKWMKGGGGESANDSSTDGNDDAYEVKDVDIVDTDGKGDSIEDEAVEVISGGKRRRRKTRKCKSSKRRRSSSRKRRSSSRRRRG